MNITEKEKEVLDLIKNGISTPSIGEMADHFEVTPQAIYKRLNNLERKGVIERTGRRSYFIK